MASSDWKYIIYNTRTTLYHTYAIGADQTVYINNPRVVQQYETNHKHARTFVRVNDSVLSTRMRVNQFNKNVVYIELLTVFGEKQLTDVINEYFDTGGVK